MSDALFGCRRLRALTIVNAFTREALGDRVCSGYQGRAGCRGDDADRVCGSPCAIRVDNGPEFISKVLEHWAYENEGKLDFSRHGKRTDNAFVQSFNGPLRTNV